MWLLSRTMPKWPAFQLVAACSLFKGGGWELGQADNFYIYIYIYAAFQKKSVAKP